MLNPDYILLYVAAPQVSEQFYAGLLGLQAVESAETFVMFVLPSGLKLGLWQHADVQPRPAAPAGAAELCISRPAESEIHTLYAEWKARGIRLVQEPLRFDFGLNFLAIDPDGHRIRVFAPPARG